MAFSTAPALWAEHSVKKLLDRMTGGC